MSSSELSQHIKLLMRKANIKSIYALAQQTDLPYGTLFSIIQQGDKPRRDTLEKIANFFNVPLSDLSAIVRNPVKTSIPLTDNLNHLMQFHYYGQRDLQRLTGIHQKSIYSILNGDIKTPRPETLKKLADCFGVSVDQLTGKMPLPKKYKT